MRANAVLQTEINKSFACSAPLEILKSRYGPILAKKINKKKISRCENICFIKYFCSATHLKVLYVSGSIIVLLQMGELIICLRLVNGPIARSELGSEQVSRVPPEVLSTDTTLTRKRSNHWITREYKMHVLEVMLILICHTHADDVPWKHYQKPVSAG